MKGVHILVAGAGLAGLAAARDLEARGAVVTVVEARERVGGRVWTLREGLGEGHHADAGADLIEEEQSHVLALARDLGLTPRRILRGGFGYYGPDGRGRRRVHTRASPWEEIAAAVAPLARDYNLSEQRWDSAIAARLARISVADWLAANRASASFAARLRAFRGFFLADPEDLAMIAVVDQFASEGSPGQGRIFRIPDGNDRLATGLAQRLRGATRLNTVVRAVRQHGEGIEATVEGADGTTSSITADYAVIALPASTARDVAFTPALPERQREAFASLRYGPATRVLLQFARPFWKRAARPSAFGTDLELGAVWDGAEQQRGAALLTCLAGGRASYEVREIIAQEGMAGVVRRLTWLGRPARLLASRVVVWDDDPWARGGYAYFDAGFDPLLRAWLARPFRRIVFAGEHTSLKWQGYMNGAIESGLRAAAEIAAMRNR
jgi:monoamine oxidase